jgi:hypothetical protein
MEALPWLRRSNIPAAYDSKQKTAPKIWQFFFPMAALQWADTPRFIF